MKRNPYRHPRPNRWPVLYSISAAIDGWLAKHTHTNRH